MRQSEEVLRLVWTDRAKGNPVPITFFAGILIVPDDSSAEPNEKELLLATLDLPTMERNSYLEKACQGNRELKNRIQVLLKNVDESGSFMAEPVVDLNRTTAMEPVEVGRHIDRYRIMEQLGEGGMGIVFVAEQTEPVRRRVALKIIKPGMDSKAVVARFEAERQALAMMDHPNIARVLDAGTTREKLPYFVMELVRGLSITQYCDQAKATLDERLRLFVDVCGAVQHAHQKGIIHRDLKPGNILVTLHDGKPVVKVIDFGVAKALHQPLTEHTIYTAFNQVVGTPLYMSPEQLEMSGLDIDTRTDIYALGVLLYEMITGTTPFDRDRLFKSGFEEMRRIIREEDPPRPSYRVTTMSKLESATFAEKPGLDQRRLVKFMESELDWVVLKALEKKRDRRYLSAADFALDIDRFLNNEAVHACPPTYSYRLRKSLQKHRFATAIFVAIFLSLCIGLLTTTWQWRRALIAEREKSKAMSLAEERAEIASKRLSVAETAIDVMYTEFAHEWLGNQSSYTPRQKDFFNKAIEAYEQLAEDMPTDSAPRPGAIRANLRAGELLRELGDYDLAMQKLTKVIDMSTKSIEKSTNEIDSSLTLVQSRILLATICRDRGDGVGNKDQADAAFRILNELAGKQNLSAEQINEIAKSFSNCARCFSAEKSTKSEAELAANEGVRLARELLSAEPQNPERMLRLANCLSSKGQQSLWWGTDNQACEAAYRESIQICKQLTVRYPDMKAAVLSLPGSMINYGVVLNRLQRRDEADMLKVEQLRLLRGIVVRFPERAAFKSLLGETLLSVGSIENRAGRKDSAWHHWRECEQQLLELVEKYPDIRSGRRSLALNLRFIAEEHKKLGEFDKARETLGKCHDNLENFKVRYPGDGEMDVIHRHVLRELAILELVLGNHANAFIAGEKILRSIEAENNSETAANKVRSDVQFYAGQLLMCELTLRIVNFCIHAAIAAKEDDSVSALYEEFRLECIATRESFLEDWRRSRPEVALEWKAIAERIDENDAWKTHQRPPSVETLSQDALLETRVFMLKDFLRVISAADSLPEDWADIVLVTASSSRFCEDTDQLLKLCSRGLQQNASHPNAKRAEAWILFRCGRWEECLARIEQLGNSPEDGFIRAMAFFQLDRKAESLSTFQETVAYINKSQEMLAARRKPEHQHPNSETFHRLQAETELLLGDLVRADQSVKDLP